MRPRSPSAATQAGSSSRSDRCGSASSRSAPRARTRRRAPAVRSRSSTRRRRSRAARDWRRDSARGSRRGSTSSCRGATRGPRSRRPSAETSRAPRRGRSPSASSKSTVIGDAVWYPLSPATSRVRPFVTGGGGYLRQLHEGETLAVTGQFYEIGGGVKITLASRADAGIKTVGVSSRRARDRPREGRRVRRPDSRGSRRRRVILRAVLNTLFFVFSCLRGYRFQIIYAPTDPTSAGRGAAPCP